MAEQAFVTLEPHGPDGVGLTRRPPYPREGLETEPPVHSSHLYVDDPAAGIKIGVWECTPQRSKMQPFGTTEFMVLLEGSVTMVEPNDVSTTVQAGQAFLVPQGLLCQWSQAHPVRKFFAIRSAPRRDPSPGSAARIVVADPGAEALAVPPAPTGLPLDAGTVLYSDPAMSYELARWEAMAPSRQTFLPRAYHVLWIEAGELTLSAEDGASRSFGVGAAVLILPGKPLEWQCSRTLRLLACRIQP